MPIPTNLTEAAKMHRRASDYTHLTELELATEAHDLNQRVAAHQAALKQNYNLTDAAQKALAADAASCDDLLTSPQLAIDPLKSRGPLPRSPSAPSTTSCTTPCAPVWNC